MKCQRCDKAATFHITELTEGVPEELHLCEDHAREYLSGGEPVAGGASSSLAEALAQQLQVTGAAEELARLDQRLCPVCGISFFEFRNQGRLGCPHDYVCFEEELEPLLVNIHGETEHTGKSPAAGPVDTAQQTDLIRLRREMQDAVTEENYERASELRDKIREIEGQSRGHSDASEKRVAQPKKGARPRKTAGEGG